VPWIYTIARHLAASRGRSQARRPASQLSAEPESGELDPAEQRACAEQAESLWQLASRVLSADQRTALWMRYVDGLTALEIGSVLGRGAPGVRVLLFRARRTLARHLPPSEGRVGALPPLTPSAWTGAA